MLRYNFQFSEVNPLTGPVKNPNTILSYGLGTEAGPIMTVGDARQNYTQTYTVTKVSRRASTHDRQRTPDAAAQRRQAHDAALQRRERPGGLRRDVVRQPGLVHAADGLRPAAPARPSSPGRARTASTRTRRASSTCSTRAFSTTTAPGDGLGQDGNGVDGFKGYNVLAFAIQIPVASLPIFPYSAPFADLGRPAAGPRAGTRRRRLCVGEPPADHAAPDRRRAACRRGRWIQVNRMGNPLFNEVLVALKDKDNYNRTLADRRRARSRPTRSNPEVAFLINFVFGTTFATTGRDRPRGGLHP